MSARFDWRHGIVLSSNYGWTVFNFRLPLLRRLRATGRDVMVLTQYDEYVAALQQEGFAVRHLYIDRSGFNPIRDLVTFAQYFWVYAKLRPSLVLHYTIKPVIWGGLAARLLRIPAIVTITGLGAVFIRRTWATSLVEYLYRAALLHAPIVFFQNAEDRDYFLKHRIVGAEQARLVPGSGIDLEHFRPVTQDTGQPFVFLLVARMLWGKGVGEFVEAARDLQDDYPGVRFQLLGPANVLNPSAVPNERLRAWQDEGLVEFLGEVADVRPYLERASCLVLPSYYREGVPRSLLEGSAMGLPVIATDVPGCRDVVDDGITGLLCRPRDAKDLANKMRQILNMPPATRDEMGRRGRSKIERQFNQNLVLSAYSAAVRDLL